MCSFIPLRQFDSTEEADSECVVGDVYLLPDGTVWTKTESGHVKLLLSADPKPIASPQEKETIYNG